MDNTKTTGLVSEIYPVIKWPNDSLRLVADKVTEFDANLQQTIINMIGTCMAHEGIGLSGPQVGINKRLVVIVLDKTPLALINPIIVQKEGKVKSKEGCLSIPGYFDDIERSKDITVSYQTIDGTVQESTAKGLLSVVVQHEMDHLNGKLFVDYLSPFKQKRAKDKVKKAVKKLQKVGR